jgi:hypothetical protein
MMIVMKRKMKEKKNLTITKTAARTSQNSRLWYTHSIKSMFRDDASGSNCLFI